MASQRNHSAWWRRALPVLSLGTAAGLFAASPASQAKPVEVDLKLVLATDVSGSINDEELGIEREGTAAAFADAAVIKAIQAGALGRIAVAALDFSNPEADKVTIDWHIIHDRATAMALAETIRDTPRTPGRRTSVSSALEMGTLLLEASDADIVSTRKVIDVSGDGPNNSGNPMMEIHDKTIAAGITVNGLPVMDDNANGYYPNLDKYYAACVAGGKGAFVIAVHNYKDFTAGMRHKLILEISQNDNGVKQARLAPAAPPRLLLKTAAETPTLPPAILHSGDNEFTGHCDIQGGGGGGYGGFGGFGNGRF